MGIKGADSFGLQLVTLITLIVPLHYNFLKWQGFIHAFGKTKCMYGVTTEHGNPMMRKSLRLSGAEKSLHEQFPLVSKPVLFRRGSRIFQTLAKIL